MAAEVMTAGRPTKKIVNILRDASRRAMGEGHEQLVLLTSGGVVLVVVDSRIVVTVMHADEIKGWFRERRRHRREARRGMA